jgi:branched-subunit amino acid ABC-type transport system permease component
MLIEQILIQTVNGVVTGMILALVASGLTLIFGIMDVVNFAHGELFILGAYVGVIPYPETGDFWIAFVVASLTIAALGAALLDHAAPAARRDSLTTIWPRSAYPLCCRTTRSGSSARWHVRSRTDLRPLHVLLP